MATALLPSGPRHPREERWNPVGAGAVVETDAEEKRKRHTSTLLPSSFQSPANTSHWLDTIRSHLEKAWCYSGQEQNRER